MNLVSVYGWKVRMCGYQYFHLVDGNLMQHIDAMRWLEMVMETINPDNTDWHTCRLRVDSGNLDYPVNNQFNRTSSSIVMIDMLVGLCKAQLSQIVDIKMEWYDDNFMEIEMTRIIDGKQKKFKYQVYPVGGWR